MIPLALVGGFFGTGKTRFLTSVLPELQARGLRTQVLLNDFESAEIDTTRLTELSSLVTSLSGECVCCSSLEELLTALATMPAAANSVTLIEANGATKTDELLGRLTTEGRLARYTLPLQVTVVDAKRWQKRWWHNALEAAQTRTATHLHINWTHRVPDTRLEAVHAGVRALNPAVVFTTPAAFADELQRLAVTVSGEDTRPPLSVPQPHHHDGSARAANHSPPAHVHGAQPHDAHTHDHQFASIVMGLPHTVSREPFLEFIRSLPTSVVRAKGLVRFADQPEAMFVWNRVDGRKAVTLDRSVPHATSQPIALFIGVGMAVDALRMRVGALHA